MLSSDGVFAAIITGTLSVTSALSLGALIVDGNGDAAAAERVRYHLAASLESAQSAGFPAPRPLSLFSQRR